MPPTLVIAGHGFVGRSVVRCFQRLGHEVIATSRRDPSATCDVTDLEAVGRLVASVTPAVVVVCSGAAHDAEPRALHGTHVFGTLNLLEAVRLHAPSAAVILLGSAAEYGDVAPGDLPVREDHACLPVNFYGCSKLAQTHLGRVAVERWGLRVRTARLFNVVGPGMPERYFFSALAARIRGLPPGETFPLRDGESTRDFVHVDDVAEAVAVLAGPDVEDGIYNVGSGVETQVVEAARHMGGLAGGVVPLDAGRSGGISRSVADVRRLRALGWSPRLGWRDAIEAIWRQPPGAG